MHHEATGTNVIKGSVSARERTRKGYVGKPGARIEIDTRNFHTEIGR
jgi:hypothetical protein